MNARSEKTIKSLIQAMKATGKGTKAYDTTAQVVRVDGDTAWVHIPGGVAETPVKLTINAVKGDLVQVRVSGGKAWIVGNETKPPTDDTRANVAVKQANKAQKAADDASKVATNYMDFNEYDGLTVGHKDLESKVNISGDGLKLYDETGKIGTRIKSGEVTVGEDEGSRVTITPDEMTYYSEEGNPYFRVQSHGTRRIEDRSRAVGESKTQTYTLDDEETVIYEGSVDVSLAMLHAENVAAQWGYSHIDIIPIGIDGYDLFYGLFKDGTEPTAMPIVDPEAGEYDEAGVTEYTFEYFWRNRGPGIQFDARSRTPAQFTKTITCPCIKDSVTNEIVVKFEWNYEPDLGLVTYSLAARADSAVEMEITTKMIACEYFVIARNPAYTMGERTGSAGDYSVAIGQGVEAKYPYQFAIGRYNDARIPYDLFMIGYGGSDASRKNIFSVSKQGNAALEGHYYAAGEKVPTQVQGGTLTITVPSNSYTDSDLITFDRPYDAAPLVVAGLGGTITAYGMGSCSCAAHSVTETGFKIRAYNNSANERNITVRWIAIRP